MRNDIEIETLEELVKLAVESKADTRYDLGTYFMNVPENEPNTLMKVGYRLTERGSGRSWSIPNSIHLGSELGKMIEEIWTKRPLFRGSSYEKPVGGMSLKGICKRLGQTGLDEQIQKYQDEKIATMERIRIENQRQHISRMAMEIKEYLVSANIEGLDANKTVNQLILGIVKESEAE